MISVLLSGSDEDGDTGRRELMALCSLILFAGTRPPPTCCATPSSR